MPIAALDPPSRHPTASRHPDDIAPSRPHRGAGPHRATPTASGQPRSPPLPWPSPPPRCPTSRRTDLSDPPSGQRRSPPLSQLMPPPHHDAACPGHRLRSSLKPALAPCTVRHPLPRPPPEPMSNARPHQAPPKGTPPPQGSVQRARRLREPAPTRHTAPQAAARTAVSPREWPHLDDTSRSSHAAARPPATPPQNPNRP